MRDSYRLWQSAQRKQKFQSLTSDFPASELLKELINGPHWSGYYKSNQLDARSGLARRHNEASSWSLRWAYLRKSVRINLQVLLNLLSS